MPPLESTLRSSRQAGFSEHAVLLGADIDRCGDQGLLDFAVTLIEGKNPRAVLADLTETYPRVAAELSRRVDPHHPELARVAARFILAVAFGMAAKPDLQRAA